MRNPREFTAKTMWVVCNYGNPVEIFHLRRQAFEYAREEVKHYPDIKNWKQLYEIHKATISPVKK